jgi:hypothetical protein
MRKLLWLIPVAFFFLNPGFGCGADDPQFQYGAEEMRAAIAGDWTFTITPTDGAATIVTVHIDQAAAPAGASAPAPGRAFVRAAHACGTRTLVKSAAACFDSTAMPLAVTYVSGDATFAELTLSGTFRVASLSFDSGDLELSIGPYYILSQVNPDGSLVNPRLGSGAQGATLTIERS